MKRIITFLCAIMFAGAVFGQTIYDYNPISNISPNPGFCSIFHYWGFIGDSLCSGEFEYTRPDDKTGYWDCYEYSWGMRMCARMGVEGEVFSKGGETAKGWIEHFWDSNKNKLGVCAKDNPKQAYIIALGVNDSNPKNTANYPCGSIPEDINFENYNKNAQSFAGCYAGIIQRIQKMQPEAKIFLVTIPDKSETRVPYNEVIRKMAEVFENVWILDIQKYNGDFYNSPEFRKLYKPNGHGHLTAAGYEYTAWEFMTYIDWIIRNDMDAFKEVGFMLPDAPERKK